MAACIIYILAKISKKKLTEWLDQLEHDHQQTLLEYLENCDTELKKEKVIFLKILKLN